MNQKSARENSLVSVTNGIEFLLIPYAELDQVQAEGYYRPSERGLTIVSDGKQLLEVPIAKVEATENRDFSDVLAQERSVTAESDDRLPPRKPRAASIPESKASTSTIASKTATSNAVAPIVVASKSVESKAAATARPDQEWKYRFSINEYIERSEQEAELARLEQDQLHFESIKSCRDGFYKFVNKRVL